MRGSRERVGRRTSSTGNKSNNQRPNNRDLRVRGRSNSSSQSAVPMRISLGIHAVKEVLKVRPAEILKLIIRKGWESSQDLQELVRDAKKNHVIIEERTSEAIDRIGTHNQGVACEIKDTSKNFKLEDIGNQVPSIVLILDGIEDPHNLGAILRTSWLMGVEAIILPSDRAVGLTSTVHKISCGGVEHVPVLRLPSLGVAIEHLKEKGFWVYGLAAGGTKTIGQVKVSNKIAWILGSEDKGLRSTTERACDDLVSIPQLDNAASYNVSVAAGITLYETSRQANSEKV